MYGKISKLAIVLILVIATSLYAFDLAEIFTLSDLEGKGHVLSNYRGKFVVLEWVNFDCPFVKKHYSSGNMQMLQKKYTEKGVAWLSICSSAQGKQGYFGDMKELKHVLDSLKWAGTAYLIDDNGNVGRTYKAKNTPLIFVLNPFGQIIYRGAIDDIASTDLEDIKKAKNYVVEVLDAVLAKKPSPFNVTEPYGCSVKYK